MSSSGAQLQINVQINRKKHTKPARAKIDGRLHDGVQYYIGQLFKTPPVPR